MSAPGSVDSNLVLFSRGVIAILQSWPALRIAVNQGWGGPDSTHKQTLLASEVVDAFEASSHASRPDLDDVEELLHQAIVEEFECEIEDGSVEKVARDIAGVWRAISEGAGEGEVRRLEQVATTAQDVRLQVKEEVLESDSESDEDDESAGMDVDAEVPFLVPSRTKSSPEVDQDGFTVVKPRGKR
ncbi:hypothetical protein FRB99_006298 [Tulasnella sp. 403]|nr:hypothetical protein FRB99_006298 [Tulasnella sp. 403]